MNTLYTWGYSKRTLDDLEVLLRQTRAVIVDVRRSTVSRWKPEFSGASLARRFKLDYRAYCTLGNQAHDLPWKRHPGWELAIQCVCELLPCRPVLLLCLEQDPAACHRTEVAEEIRGRCGCEVVTL